MAIKPTPQAGLMDRNVPAQLDEEDLRAEIELELPMSQETEIIAMTDGEGPEIEITAEEDGGVVIDFNPSASKDDEVGFYDNLAETMDDGELGSIAGDLLGEFSANKASRQDWEDTYTNGLQLLGFNYERIKA